jgi:hypothetical protein
VIYKDISLERRALDSLEVKIVYVVNIWRRFLGGESNLGTLNFEIDTLKNSN